MSEINIDCCSKDCPKGKKVSEQLLESNNSAYDAAIDFWAFVKDCSLTCPYIKSKEIEKER